MSELSGGESFYQPSQFQERVLWVTYRKLCWFTMFIKILLLFICQETSGMIKMSTHILSEIFASLTHIYRGASQRTPQRSCLFVLHHSVLLKLLLRNQNHQYIWDYMSMTTSLNMIETATMRIKKFIQVKSLKRPHDEILDKR